MLFPQNPADQAQNKQQGTVADPIPVAEGDPAEAAPFDPAAEPKPAPVDTTEQMPTSKPMPVDPPTDAEQKPVGAGEPCERAQREASSETSVEEQDDTEQPTEAKAENIPIPPMPASEIPPLVPTEQPEQSAAQATVSGSVFIGVHSSAYKMRSEPQIEETPEGQFTFVRNEKGYTLISFVGKNKEVRIPAKYKDQPVTRIHTQAFKGKKLHRLVIADTVERIDDEAFYGCSNLKSIIIPAAVTRIGNGIFRDCTSLAEAVFCDALTDIGSYTFYGCTALTTVKLSAVISRIGEYAFANCDALENVVLGDTITEIGDYAFWRCDKLESARIGASVKKMGMSVFADCKVLGSLELSEGLSALGESFCANCRFLTHVEFPDSITQIPADAFRKCPLETVSFGAELKEIERGAFAKCNKLETVRFRGKDVLWKKVKIRLFNDSLRQAEVQCY